MTSTAKTRPLLLTAREAAATLAISQSETRRLVKSGELEPRYIGKGTREYRVTYESVEAYFNSLSPDPRVEEKAS